MVANMVFGGMLVEVELSKLVRLKGINLSPSPSVTAGVLHLVLHHSTAGFARPSTKPLTEPPNPVVLDDSNILTALSENWDPNSSSILSPGFDKGGILKPSTKNGSASSSLAILERKPQNLFESFAFALIKDTRDLEVFEFALKASLTLIPSALYLFFVQFRWWHGLLHIAMVVAQATCFHLAIHVSSHRKMWKWDALDYYIPCVLGPLFGQTFFTYYLHHIKMHHVADNTPDDISSTVYFQRDSFVHFLYYFGRFYFLAWFDLPRYFLKHNQKVRALKAFVLEVGSILAALTLAYYHFWPTLCCFIVPFNASRYGMMSGNWVQHAFLEPTDPLGGGLKNSITIINSPYNKANFNDCYHASHHLNAKRHWTEHPKEFFKKKTEYFNEKALVLKDLDYDAVFFYLMTKRYDKLAAKWVNLDPSGLKPSVEEVEEILRRKTRRFTRSDLKRLYGDKKL
ncbi:hypothetical protein HDV05_002516 [Chytridiales sp. JEL 0842]|nr:hypothetical protein HDV05_002516 [Chytridiales sp. JEL 0842]